MCAIVDANIRHQLFDRDHKAGTGFRRWLRSSRHARIAVGGTKYRRELYKTSHTYRKWYNELKRAGRTIELNDEIVDSKTQRLQRRDECCSDDEHIITLALESGARLLYSNDKSLHDDFKNKTLINKPRGKVYSTLSNTEFNKALQQLLNDPNLCQS